MRFDRFFSHSSSIFRAHPPDGHCYLEIWIFWVGRSDVSWFCAACLWCVRRTELKGEVCDTPRDPTIQIRFLFFFFFLGHFNSVLIACFYFILISHSVVQIIASYLEPFHQSQVPLPCVRNTCKCLLCHGLTEPWRWAICQIIVSNKTLVTKVITVWLFLTFGKQVLRGLSPQWIIPGFLCFFSPQTRAPTTDAHRDQDVCSDGSSPCLIRHCLAMTDTGDSLEMPFFSS